MYRVHEKPQDVRIDERHLTRVLEQSNIRLDANETATLTRELNYARSATYDIEYAEFKARKFIPIANDVPPGADTMSVRSWDHVGSAKLISNYAEDLPLVDAYSTEEFSPIYPFGNAYQYTVQDLERSRFAGTFQIDTRRARAAREGFEAKLEEVAATGIASAGIKGLLNHANVPIVSKPTADTWVTSGQTPAEILQDLLTLEASIPTATKDRHSADTLLLPPSRYGTIASTPISDTTPTIMILDAFLQRSRGVKNVDTWLPLETAGASNVKRMIMYKRDPSVVELVIPQEFRELQPQAKSLAFVIPCYGRIGGVRFWRPLAAAYMDGL